MNAPNPDRQMTRRAVIATAPALAALPLAVAVASPALAAENPDLVKAGEAAADAEARFNAAVMAYDAAYAEWAPQWPAAPDSCVDTQWNGSLWGAEIERGLDGRAINRSGDGKFKTRLYSVSELENRSEWMRSAMAKDAKRKSRASRKTRDYWESEIAKCDLGAVLLPGYLAECARIKAVSNFDAIREARTETAKEIFQAVWKVLGTSHTTAAGLKIKAEAVATIGRMPTYDMQWAQLTEAGPGMPSMAAVLAEAVLQIEEGQA